MSKPSRALRSILVPAISLALVAGAAIFAYRYQILQYSAEKIVRKSLPGYITVDKMSFNFKDSRIVFRGIRIINPPGFSGKHLIDIGEAECRYRMKSVSMLDGFEVLDPVIRKPVLYIERAADGKTNLREMTAFIQSKDGSAPPEPKAASSEPSGAAAGTAKASGAVKAPENFIVKDGKVIFLDRMISSNGYEIKIERVEANLGLKLDSSYTKPLQITTAGSGIVNGREGETLTWDTKFDPTANELTMSNRFNVRDVDITAFMPYIDKFSPLAIRSGYFSGLLIFDFDNGNIGSTNEVALSNMSFEIKRGFEHARFLETTVPDLVKYFTSSSGDIIFDFKIKGRMSDPQFYLGPISKQAVAAMAVDKIAEALANAAKEQANPQNPAAGKQSDMEKAAEYIDMVKDFLKEKK
ncbi:MAG: DUF748 domain-containing protein [Candidatus Omnitrophota bacterium]